jgi:hypothetical protein
VIIEDAAALVALADRRNTLQQLVAEAKRFATRQQQLGTQLARLQTAAATLTLFRGQDVGFPPIPTSAATAAAKAVADAATAYAADPQATLGGLGDTEKRVAGFADKLEKAIQDCWSEYARGRARSDNEDLLGVLEKIPDFKPTVKKVRALRAQLHAQMSAVPSTVAALAAFHATLAAIAQEWNTLGSDAVPPAVIDFLRKAVSAEGARLDVLLEDAAITKWLTEKKLMPAFRIRLA